MKRLVASLALALAACATGVAVDDAPATTRERDAGGDAALVDAASDAHAADVGADAQGADVAIDQGGDAVGVADAGADDADATGSSDASADADASVPDAADAATDAGAIDDAAAEDACAGSLTDPANCGACGNACGATQACTNGACVDVDPCDAVAVSYGFESDAQGFTHGPTDSIAGDDPWALGKPSGVTCHGGTRCWATVLGSGGYNSCQTAYLMTPALDLRACAASPRTVTLSFWHHYAFEVKSSGQWWDGGVLQRSTDDGATWSDVTTSQPYQGAITGSYGGCTPTPDISGHAGWSDTIPGGGWAQVTYDVPAGERVAALRLRWLFGSDEATEARGWFIDDVAVSPH